MNTPNPDQEPPDEPTTESSPEVSPPVKDEIAQVLQANQRFYEAHENRDLEMMSSVWEHSSRVICIHPGWPTLKGWDAVRESWSRIFAGPGRNQFILTNIAGTMHGNVAWVVLDENLMDQAGTGTIAATNIFIRTPVGWRMTLHQGSPIARRQVPAE